jgi:hypothetical protein
MKHKKLTANQIKRFPSLLGILMLVAACNDVTECKQDGSMQTAFNKLICQNSPQTLGTDGTATLTFYCYWDWESSTQGVRPNGPVREIEVTFTSVGGSCTASGKTDSNGLVNCVFTAPNPATFEGGTVTATVKSYTRYSDGSERESLFNETTVGEILPRERPSKEKTKPRIRIVDVLEGGKKTGDEGRIIPLVSDEGKAKIVYVVDERTQGESVDRPVQGAEVLFQIANKTQQEIAELVKTITEKATTDENGQAVCEVEVKDPSAFNGVELTAKTTVKYSDGEVTVEDKTEVGPAAIEFKSFSLSGADSPQTIGTDGKATITFILTGSSGAITRPAPGRKVHFYASNLSGGTLEPDSGVTDSEGKVTTVFTASKGGTSDGFSYLEFNEDATDTEENLGRVGASLDGNDSGGMSVTAECTVLAPEISREEVVDLGLSVKWRGWNVDATKPEEAGNKYCWGETATKDDPYMANYKWYNEDTGVLTKYTQTDGRTVLEPADDVASVKLGGGWRMPTEAEMIELLEQGVWIRRYYKGTHGFSVTGKTTGKTIFLPGDGSYGLYWSSTLHSDPRMAWTLYWNSHSLKMRGENGRWDAFPVRPVMPNE